MELRHFRLLGRQTVLKLTDLPVVHLLQPGTLELEQVSPFRWFLAGGGGRVRGRRVYWL